MNSNAKDLNFDKIFREQRSDKLVWDEKTNSYKLVVTYTQKPLISETPDIKLFNDDKILSEHDKRLKEIGKQGEDEFKVYSKPILDISQGVTSGILSQWDSMYQGIRLSSSAK